MANVIDIVVRGTNDAHRALAEVTRQTEAANTGFVAMASRVRALAAPTLIVGTAMLGVAAAAVKMAKDLADTVEELDKVSARTGLSIEAVQVYRQILEEAGSSAESFAIGLTFLSRAIATDDPVLKKLHITTKDTGEAFRQLIKIIADSTDETLRNEVAFRLLGRGSGDLIANAKALADGFDGMRSSLSASGKLITEETAPAIRQLDSEMDKLGRNWGGIWRGMQQATVPAATAIIQAINDIFNAAKGTKGSPARFGMFGAFAGAGAGVIGMPGVPLGAGGAGTSNANRLLKDALDKNAAATVTLADLIRGASATPPPPGLRTGIGGFGSFGVSTPVPEVPGPRALDPRHQVLGDWKSTIDQITSSATVLDETLNSLFTGLQSGFQQAFSGILQGTMNFASAMKNLFKSLVSEIISQLARLAAAKVFKLLLNLAGVPFVGDVGGAIIEGGQGAPIHPGESLPGRARGVTNVYISTIDSKSYTEQMRSRLGVLNVVEGRAALVGEV